MASKILKRRGDDKMTHSPAAPKRRRDDEMTNSPAAPKEDEMTR